MKRYPNDLMYFCAGGVWYSHIWPIDIRINVSYGPAKEDWYESVFSSRKVNI